jgi:iduronate 2-sulfatase
MGSINLGIRFRDWTALGLAVLIVVSHGGLVDISAIAAEKRPNVLFIVADDLNTHLGCYGYEVKTPSIDELARRGMRFDRAYCQDPLCNPSRVSFLSGLRPDKTRVYTLATHTREYLGDWIMLPEYFRKNGYFTVQVGKVYHTDEGFEDPRSWDVEIRETGKQPPRNQIVKSGEPAGPGGHSIDWEWLSTADEKTPDGVVARKAIGYMEKAIADKKRFFLGVGFRRPHAPFAAPQKYFEQYPLEAVKLADAVPKSHHTSLLPAAVNYPTAKKPMSEKEQHEVVAAYSACTSFMDAQVGVLLDALQRLGLWENTVVVFIGDHGYHLGEHGGLWHKLSLFEESARVPMIIYAPNMKAKGQPCSQLVEMIDLYPTLVSLCGLPARSGLDGIDLSPLLEDPTRPSKPAAYTVVARTNDPSVNQSQVMDFLGRSVRTDRWRYTEWDGGKRGVELYDHESDPHEWNNLAHEPQLAEIIRQLHQLLLAAESASGKSP